LLVMLLLVSITNFPKSIPVSSPPVNMEF
jgi:hypothetical protein